MADKEFKRYGSSGKRVEYSGSVAFVMTPRSHKVIDLFTLSELERLVAEMKELREPAGEQKS